MPHLGRWASPDPLQVHAGGGGEFGNSFHYVSGNLLQARDPNGFGPASEGNTAIDSTATNAVAGHDGVTVTAQAPGAAQEELSIAWSEVGSGGTQVISFDNRIFDTREGAFADARARQAEIDASTGPGQLLAVTYYRTAGGSILPTTITADTAPVLYQNILVQAAARDAVAVIGDNASTALEDIGYGFVPFNAPLVGRAAGALARGASRRAVREVPQGLTRRSFGRASEILRREAGHLSDDIVVHGSRANGTSRIGSDIDIAIRVSSERFAELIRASFRTPNPGSARERTMLHAIETGKIQAGEAGLRALRRQLARELDMPVDVSIIEIGGAFDNGPFVQLF